MKGKDEIKDLFSDKLGGYEVKVNPELWSNISANIGTSSTGATVGLSVLTKTIIGLSVVAATITGFVLLTNDATDNVKTDVQPIITSIESNNVKKDSPIEKEEKVSTTLVDNTVLETTVGITEEEAIETELQTEEVETQLEEFDINVVTEDIKLDEQEEAGPPTFEEEQEVDIDEEHIVLEEDLTDEAQEEQPTKLVLSNIITPNNDMNNDFLFVESVGLSDFNVVILNSQNKVVYQSNDPEFRWNGIGIDGAPVENGSYVYFVTARDKNGNPVNQHSSLTVVR